MLEMIEYEHFNVPPPQGIGRADTVLRDVLDAHEALGLATETLVPASVLAWYRSDDYFGNR